MNKNNNPSIIENFSIKKVLFPFENFEINNGRNLK